MWLSIEYRDFYDVPRVFVVEHEGRVLLFDCPFDEDAEEYPADYGVYQLTRWPTQESWELIGTDAKYLGAVRVSTVVFDPTGRTSIDASVLEGLR